MILHEVLNILECAINAGREATFTSDYRLTEDWPGSLEGLYHYRSRNYLPHLGQFNRMDEVWTANRYGYVEGNPVMWGDPFGYCTDSAYEQYKNCYETHVASAAKMSYLLLTVGAYTTGQFGILQGVSSATGVVCGGVSTGFMIYYPLIFMAAFGTSNYHAWTS
jgi:RHS repeat-associated protein